MSAARVPLDELWVCHLGLIPYADGLAIQGQLRDRRQEGAVPDTLLLLEHPPTYTRGRRSGASDLPMPESFYRARGIEVHTTDRGGKLTYHGPGQLVGYPIMAVTDIGRYLRTMERAIVDALAEVGVRARSRHREGIDYTGVWVEDRKIASIGVHVSRGVTTHGFAVNVENDLEPFSWVVACGLPDVQMTSLACLSSAVEGAPRGALESAGACESLSCFRKRVAHSFARAHGRRQRLVSAARLGIAATDAHARAERAPIKSSPAPTAEPALL